MQSTKTSVRNPVDVHIGQRLAQELQRQKITVQKAAESFDASTHEMEDMLQGRTRISPERLMRACLLVGRPIQWFFEDFATDNAEAITCNTLH